MGADRSDLPKTDKPKTAALTKGALAYGPPIRNLVAAFFVALAIRQRQEIQN